MNFNFDLHEKNNFISSQEQLLPTLNSNSVVQQNSNFIETHPSRNSTSVHNFNLKKGVVNPITRQTLKKLLNINTRFRDNYTSTLSTNFTLELPSTIRKVVSLKLIDCNFPEMVYTVSEKLGSNSFIIDGSLVQIESGSYSNFTMVNEINKQFKKMKNNKKISYNPINGLMTIQDLSDVSFNIDFRYSNNNCPLAPNNIINDQLTLGWILGFRGDYLSKIKSKPTGKFTKIRDAIPTLKPNNYLKQNIICCPELKKYTTDISFVYNSSSSYTGESLFDIHGTPYFLISVNDFQNNHDNAFISAFKYQSSSDKDILAKISTKCCDKTWNENIPRLYFGPTDITRLEIKIYDEYGRIVDINNADFSISLEIESIYDL